VKDVAGRSALEQIGGVRDGCRAGEIAGGDRPGEGGGLGEDGIEVDIDAAAHDLDVFVGGLGREVDGRGHLRDEPHGLACESVVEDIAAAGGAGIGDGALHGVGDVGGRLGGDWLDRVGQRVRVEIEVVRDHAERAGHRSGRDGGRFVGDRAGDGIDAERAEEAGNDTIQGVVAERVLLRLAEVVEEIIDAFANGVVIGVPEEEHLEFGRLGVGEDAIGVVAGDGPFPFIARAERDLEFDDLAGGITGIGDGGIDVAVASADGDGHDIARSGGLDEGVPLLAGHGVIAVGREERIAPADLPGGGEGAGEDPTDHARLFLALDDVAHVDAGEALLGEAPGGLVRLPGRGGRGRENGTEGGQGGGDGRQVSGSTGRAHGAHRTSSRVPRRGGGGGRIPVCFCRVASDGHGG
jgi:hypothetical protein